MTQEKLKIIHEEKARVGPMWYTGLFIVTVFSAYLIIRAPRVTWPVVAGAFLIILVETVFSYPIKYVLTESKLLARSGLIFKVEMPYNEIEEIEAVSWYKLYFYAGGNRIAGMPKGKVIIINPKTDRLIITPSPEMINIILEKTGIKIKA